MRSLFSQLALATRLTSLILITSALALKVAHAAPVGTVITANEKAGTISAVDLTNGKSQSVALNVMPHNVQVTPEGQYLLVVGMAMKKPEAMTGMPNMSAGMQMSENVGQLLGFSLTDLRNPAFIADAGQHPAHVVTDQTGKLAFVTDSAASVVRVFNLSNHLETASISTGTYPHGLRLSPDGKELYVANMKDNSVSILDVGSLSEVARIPVGKAPVQVGFRPDGMEAYVSLSAENKIGVIDTHLRKLVQTIPVGRTPIQMFATPDGRELYVANQGSSKQPDNRVSIIDLKTRKVISTVTVGNGAHGVAMSKDGNYAFVSNIESGTFSVIDTHTHALVATHSVGAGPNGITYTTQ